jgi:hypothetical protein
MLAQSYKTGMIAAAERFGVQLPRARLNKRVKNPTISREAVSWNTVLGGRLVMALGYFVMQYSRVVGSIWNMQKKYHFEYADLIDTWCYQW